MKKLRLVAFLTVGCAFVTAAPLAACSDDTSLNPTVDGGGTPDSPSGDAATDTNVTDAPPDTAQVDSGLTVDTIADVVSAHMCTALARCCFGNANPADGGVDGGSFDRAKCQSVYADIGFENSSVGHTLFVSGGKVTLDAQKASDCLAKIDALTCSLTGAAFQDIRTTCFAAVKGLATAGQPCEQSVECASGLFCEPTTAGGNPLTGKCAALKSTGQSCGLFTSGIPGANAIKSEEACSYRGSGSPALFCDSFDAVGNYSDPTEWTCKGAVANGQPCNDSVWCSSGICDPGTFTCASPLEYFSGAGCNYIRP